MLLLAEEYAPRSSYKRGKTRHGCLCAEGSTKNMEDCLDFPF